MDSFISCEDDSSTDEEWMPEDTVPKDKPRKQRRRTDESIRRRREKVRKMKEHKAKRKEKRRADAVEGMPQQSREDRSRHPQRSSRGSPEDSSSTRHHRPRPSNRSSRSSRSRHEHSPHSDRTPGAIAQRRLEVCKYPYLPGFPEPEERNNRRDLVAPTGEYQHNFTDNYGQKKRPPRQILSNFDRFLANTNLGGADEVIAASKVPRPQLLAMQPPGPPHSVAYPTSAAKEPLLQDPTSYPAALYYRESPETSSDFRSQLINDLQKRCAPGPQTSAGFSAPRQDPQTSFRVPDSRDISQAVRDRLSQPTRAARDILSQLTQAARDRLSQPTQAATDPQSSSHLIAPSTKDIKLMRAQKVARRLDRSLSSNSRKSGKGARIPSNMMADAVVGPAYNSLMDISSQYHDSIDGISYSDNCDPQNMDLSDDEMDQHFEVVDDFEDLPPSPDPPSPPPEEEPSVDIISPQEAERLYPPRKQKTNKKYYQWYKELEEPYKGTSLEGVMQYVPIKENNLLKREEQVEDSCCKTMLAVGQRYVVWLDVSNPKYICFRKVYRQKPEGSTRISYRSFCNGHGIIRLDASKAFYNCPFENPTAMRYLREATPNTVPPPHHVSVDASEPSNILIASIQSFRGDGHSSTSKKKRFYPGCTGMMVLFPHYVDPELGEISFPLTTQEEKECFGSTVFEFYFYKSFGRVLEVTGLHDKVEALAIPKPQESVLGQYRLSKVVMQQLRSRE